MQCQVTLKVVAYQVLGLLFSHILCYEMIQRT